MRRTVHDRYGLKDGDDGVGLGITHSLYTPRRDRLPPGAGRDYVEMVKAFAKRKNELSYAVLKAYDRFYKNMQRRSKP